MTQSEEVAETFLAPTVSSDFSKTCFLLFNFKTSSPPPGKKAHSEFCKPKRPRVHNSSSALIVTKVTWHNQPPAPARTALWESWVPCGSRHATGPVTLLGERQACEWAHAHILIFPPSSQVKDRAHFFLSQIQSGFEYAYMYSFICSVAHDYFPAGERTTHTSRKQDENATRLRARDWDFTRLLQKYETPFLSRCETKYLNEWV